MLIKPGVLLILKYSAKSVLAGGVYFFVPSFAGKVEKVFWQILSLIIYFLKADLLFHFIKKTRISNSL